MGSEVVNYLQPYWQHIVKEVPLGLVLFKEKPGLTKVLLPIAAAGILFTLFSMFTSTKNKKKFPPVVPGLPIVGNLLQLMDKKPHRSFTSWSEKYGPIFTIRTGLLNQVVITSSELAKEAMVTKYEFISKRQLGTSLNILSGQKTLVALSDYGEEHRLLKKIVMTNLLGPSPQRENRPIRDSELQKMMQSLYTELKGYPQSAGEVNVRQYIKQALFSFALRQAFGRDIEEVHVAGMGTLSKWEIFDILVTDPMRGAILIDWRDFFPRLKRFISNRVVENEVNQIATRRSEVIRALIAEQRKHLEGKAKSDFCYVDHLLTNYQSLNDTQLLMSVWEPVVESADTPFVTTEWAMYELALQPSKQERLYQEIREVVGDRAVTEDDLAKFPYLTAVVKETLRKYSPVPLLPPRLVEQDVQIGGYHIPAGWHVLINMYGINHNKETWPEPDVWDPERLVGDQKLDLGLSDFRVMPFGAGKRICAGMAQAMFVIPMYVATFVQNFTWTLPATEDKVHEVDNVFVTTHKLHPLKAIATPRSQQV